MRESLFALAILAGLGLTAAQALAAGNDQSFARAAAQSGLAEVQMGQLAQQKATSTEVKQFGKTLVADHTQANQELQQIAEQQGLSLPAQLSENQKSEKQKLESMPGTQFDQQFAQSEVKDHQKAIAEFEQEAKSGKDSTLKAFAEKTIPVLKKHLQIAQSIARENR